jgi:hypothetical protein
MDGVSGVTGRTRVLVDDTRRNGAFLRITWHADGRQFVVSNWDGQVCVGATQVSVEDAPRIMALLAEGLADAASHPVESEPPAPASLRRLLVDWWRGRRRTAVITELRDRVARRGRRAA